MGEIDRGLLVLVGVEPEDTEQTVTMAERLLRYRVFSDAEGKMNLNVAQVGGAILLVSQFTLAADSASGNRPGFSTAAPPEQASSCVTRWQRPCARAMSRSRQAASAPTCRWRW